MSDETRFPGFPGRGARYTAIPDLFFSRLLADVADLVELKALLYVFWRLRRKRADGQYVTLNELAGIPTVLGAFGETVEAAREGLRSALEAGVRRGTLLEVVVDADGARESVYFLNTPADAERVRRVRAGELALRLLPPRVAALPPRPRPWHALWEARIGLLTPEVARALDRAVEQHGEAAIQRLIEAAERAERPWSFIRARLERLSSEGEWASREEPA